MCGPSFYGCSAKGKGGSAGEMLQGRPEGASRFLSPLSRGSAALHPGLFSLHPYGMMSVLIA